MNKCASLPLLPTHLVTCTLFLYQRCLYTEHLYGCFHSASAFDEKLFCLRDYDLVFETAIFNV